MLNERGAVSCSGKIETGIMSQRGRDCKATHVRTGNGLDKVKEDKEEILVTQTVGIDGIDIASQKFVLVSTVNLWFHYHALF